MHKAWQVARKELASYFSSPVAFLFLAAFLAINLFVFFWVEKFFARNIADVRPLFEWMPLLLVFLVGALTMRMWSEERRSGTVEFLLTLPLSSLQLVLGKFLACMSLVAIALALTLPIPLSVSFLGDLDWGPVFAAYLATLFLAAAYTAVGLYVSSKTENQIVSLIGSVVACLILYLIGSEALTPFVGNKGVEILKLVGSGSRFESITRGVLDIRDIYYYISVIGVFMSLNVFSLERLRWSVEGQGNSHGRWKKLTYLCVLNFLLANFWLHGISGARLDFTSNKAYSISRTTKNHLQQLREPLLIRGYFSSRTHPLLAPLVPQLRDLIREYATVSQGRVRAEFIDPRENPELEEEASKKFGIKPVPFQISDRYEASLVNSYFDVVIKYGDKHEVLNFQDLIEVQFRGEGDLEVQLRNPEYDLTKTIKKVLYGFQTTDNLFASLATPVILEGYISPDEKLPEPLREYKAKFNEALDEIAQGATEKLKVVLEDPQAGDGALAKDIEEKYGLRPMAASLFDQNTFYFYTLLRDKEKTVLVPIPENLSKEGAKRSIEAGLKRFSSGFLKTVGVSAPVRPRPNPFMPNQPGGKSFQMLSERLQENYTIKNIDLETGTVPEDIDFLLVAAPEALTNKGVFAVDQFLMKGGSVMLLSGAFSVNRAQQSLTAKEHQSGLEEWLKHSGITVEKEMVLDPQNEKYPVPTKRQIAPGVFIPELRLLTYPYFVDIRSDGMNQDLILTSGIPQMTMNWGSPLTVELPEGSALKNTVLLQSSADSWRSNVTQIIPNFELFPNFGFAQHAKSPAVLATLVEGEFSSFFAGKDSPLLAKEEEPATPPAEGEEEKEEKEVISGVIEKSPNSARIILFASNEFVEDSALQISASSGSNRFMNSLQLVQNSIDWSLEDRGLLAIRSRGHFSRTLNPLERSQQLFWEYGNYAFALLGLLIVFAFYRGVRTRARAHYQDILGGAAAA